MRPPPEHHIIMAQRYSEWARQQIDRANQTLNPKARNDRLALAEYYSQLAERELAAAERLKSAVKPSQPVADVLPARPSVVTSKPIQPSPGTSAILTRPRRAVARAVTLSRPST